MRLLEEDRINGVVNEGHKLYFRDVLDALSQGKDYVSYEDWEDYMPPIEIDNLNYKPGEQMLPKVNKTIHSLGNKTLLLPGYFSLNNVIVFSIFSNLK